MGGIGRRIGTMAPRDGSAPEVRSWHHFLLDALYEILYLALHLFHALAHLQDDCNTR